ncbi:hypothetical protein [uncultured Thiohalocapsa sp.]|nr:hypothetical protein [uncultured Thiohalocapsa sp.]
MRLTEATRTSRSLEDIMDDLAGKAQARGLTPELLDEILNAAD